MGNDPFVEYIKTLAGLDELPDNPDGVRPLENAVAKAEGILAYIAFAANANENESYLLIFLRGMQTPLNIGTPKPQEHPVTVKHLDELFTDVETEIARRNMDCRAIIHSVPKGTYGETYIFRDASAKTIRALAEITYKLHTLHR